MLKHTNIELRASPLCVSANGVRGGVRDGLGADCPTGALCRAPPSSAYFVVQSAPPPTTTPPPHTHTHQDTPSYSGS